MTPRRTAQERIAEAVAAAGEIASADSQKQARTNVPSGLSSSEEHILRCLGAAVIDQWSDLPTNVQRLLFERATALGAPRHTVHLKEQIARFLHSHKSDIRPNP